MSGSQDAGLDSYMERRMEARIPVHFPRTVVWGVDKRQVRRFWISHVEVRILPPQPVLNEGLDLPKEKRNEGVYN